jgi:hypothetical protein
MARANAEIKISTAYVHDFKPSPFFMLEITSFLVLCWFFFIHDLIPFIFFMPFLLLSYLEFYLASNLCDVGRETLLKRCTLALLLRSFVPATRNRSVVLAL